MKRIFQERIARNSPSFIAMNGIENVSKFNLSEITLINCANLKQE